MFDVSRCGFVRGVLLLPSLAALLDATARAAAEEKAQQPMVQYQSKPYGEDRCSRCRFFIPSPAAGANGTCKVVDGSISPIGYCIAYNPK